MSNSLLETDIKDILVDEGIASFGVDLFIGKEPIAPPDDCLTIYATGGPEQDPKNPIDELRFMIRGRNNDYVTGAGKIADVVLALNGRAPETVNSNKYRGFYLTGPPILIETDSSERSIFTANFRTYRIPADAGQRS